MVFAEVSRSVAGDRSCPLSARPRLGPGEWRDFGAVVTRLAEHCAGSGVRIAYHHHMGTVIESEDENDRLMAATGDAVGLRLDTGHLAFAGVDPKTIAARHCRRINHVHCGDVRPEMLARVRNADSSFLDAVLNGVFTVPGDGFINFAGILQAASASDYRGWLVVEAEQDPVKAPPLVHARNGSRT